MSKTYLIIAVLCAFALTSVSGQFMDSGEQNLLGDAGSTCFEWVNQAGYRYDTLYNQYDYNYTIPDTNTNVTFDVCG
jgi:hypothetical protein